VYLLSREHIPPSNTLSASIIQGFLSNSIAVLFFYLGVFYLYSRHRIADPDQEFFWAIILLVAFLMTWLTIQTILHEAFRKKVWQICLRAGIALFTKIGRPHWINTERAEVFFQNFNGSLNMIMRNREMLIFPASLVLIDWVFMFLCLKFSFTAINYLVSNKVLMVGFSIGLFMSMFSLAPASIGLMEGSMAGAFYWMGLDYESSLLWVTLYNGRIDRRAAVGG